MRYFVCGESYEAKKLSEWLLYKHNIPSEPELNIVGVTTEDAAFLILTYKDKSEIMRQVRIWEHDGHCNRIS